MNAVTLYLTDFKCKFNLRSFPQSSGLITPHDISSNPTGGICKTASVFAM